MTDIEQAHRAVSLLLQAARIDPVLVDAVRTVDRYLHDVEGQNERMQAALHRFRRWTGERHHATLAGRGAAWDEVKRALLEAAESGSTNAPGPS